MVNARKPKDFFVVGGTLDREAASYIRRSADDDLLRFTLEGEYCNVLAARQTGKSSLMVRTSERLKKHGVKPVIIDLTSIGSQVSASEWYFGLISYLTRHLNLTVDAQLWWNERQEKSPVQRFSEYLHEVILTETQEPIVIFIDEIDSTLKLEFTDDFFAAIRAMYNARSQYEDLKRLTFVLLGVARPVDLIKDHTRTPYNIGIGIDITDFQIEELGAFETVLEKAYPGKARQILEWVLDWTGGQPYLTQKLCNAVVGQVSGFLVSKDSISQLVERLFLGDMARTETNIRSIRDQAKNNPNLAKMLRIYKRVLANHKVKAEEQSIEQNELKLTGLVKTTTQGMLQARNRIYAHVFDERWVRENIPVSTTQRWTIITSIIAIIAITVAGYSFYRQQNQTVEIQARTYINNFNSSGSPEVKITSLAGIFALGNDYIVQARELFAALGPEEQLVLFNLSRPANVGEELVIVVNGVYQNEEDSPEGNNMLKAMADSLEQTSAPGATNLALEINNWLDARSSAASGDYPIAISLYTRAFEYSKDRDNENVAILLERAAVYTNLEQYDNALADYNDVVGIDTGRATEVQNKILENRKLADYWQAHSSEYLNLLAISQEPITVNLAYSMPQSMSVGDTALIEFLVNPSVSQNILATEVSELSGLPNLTVEPGQTSTYQGGESDIGTGQITITNRVRIELQSQNSSLEILALQNSSEKLISPIETTPWRWSVTAREAGRQILILNVYSLINVDNNENWRLVESIRTEIDVGTPTSLWVARLEWNWILAILAATILILLLIRWYVRRMKKRRTAKN